MTTKELKEGWKYIKDIILNFKINTKELSDRRDIIHRGENVPADTRTKIRIIGATSWQQTEQKRTKEGRSSRTVPPLWEMNVSSGNKWVSIKIKFAHFLTVTIV